SYPKTQHQPRLHRGMQRSPYYFLPTKPDGKRLVHCVTLCSWPSARRSTAGLLHNTPGGAKNGLQPALGCSAVIHGRAEASAQHVLKCTKVMHFGLGAYPNNSGAPNAISAQAKCKKAR